MNRTINIAIVDDHPLLRAGVASTLRRRGDFKVVEQGGCAEDAQSIAVCLKPDVLLMDVNMPGNIFATVKAIAKLAPSVKVLMLTVSESAKDAYSALDAGARGYILKGISGLELAHAIRQVVNGNIFITPEFASRLLSSHQATDSERSTANLTHREEQVIREVSKGLTNKQVAEVLSISEKTVKYYMTKLMHKMNAQNRTDAVNLLRRDFEKEQAARIGFNSSSRPLDEISNGGHRS